MKNQLERLASLNLDLEMFYVITMRDDQIQLQGHINYQVRRLCEAEGFVFGLSESNWIQAQKDGIEITLTF
jgi:hypothetical protein